MTDRAALVRSHRLAPTVGGAPLEHSDGELTVLDPSTAGSLASDPGVGTEGADRAVAAAVRALDAWGIAPPRERSERPLGLAALIEEHADGLADLEALDVGMPQHMVPAEIPVADERLARGRPSGDHVDDAGRKGPYNQADLDRLAESYFLAAFRSASQDCHAASRICITRAVADPVAETVRGVAETLTVGDRLDATTTMGELVSRDQQARVGGLVARALAQSSADLVTGGRPDPEPGFYYQPTVLTNVRHGDEIVREELFGPIATVATFDDQPDAVRKANDAGSHGWAPRCAACMSAAPSTGAGRSSRTCAAT